MSTEKTKVKLPVMFWVLQSITLLFLVILLIGLSNTYSKVNDLPTTSPDLSSTQLDNIEKNTTNSVSQGSRIIDYVSDIKSDIKYGR